MEQIELQAATREILGKKVRFLRRQGITPVHLFGHNVKSLALQCDTAQLQQVLAQAGKTRLVSLQLDKGKKPRSIMIREIQKDWRFLRWSGKSLKIHKDDILTLREHSISLDKFNLYKLKQIEIDYQSAKKTSCNTVVVYREQVADSKVSINRLVQDIQDILEISHEIEYTESSDIIIEKKRN